jgi:hypothetical protein
MKTSAISQPVFRPRVIPNGVNHSSARSGRAGLCDSALAAVERLEDRGERLDAGLVGRIEPAHHVRNPFTGVDTQPFGTLLGMAPLLGGAATATELRDLFVSDTTATPAATPERRQIVTAPSQTVGG